jgi:hypothetical protein
MTLRDKLLLLIPKEDSLCDMKILCVTQQSFVYQIANKTLAKQPLIKDEYSQDEKTRLLLNNVYQGQMQIMQQTGSNIYQCFEFDDNENLMDYIWSIG